MKYGRLRITEEAEKGARGKRRVRCLCDCGKEVIVYFQSLKSGNTTSCGCYRHEIIKEINSTHKMTHSKLYNTWRGMKERCTNPKSINFKNYGGRGISLCSDWVDFERFREWAVENGYVEGSTIDRKNNNGNYEPSNCRWANQKEQNNHRRSNRILSYHGQSLTVSQWSELTGIGYRAILSRLESGWPIEKTLSIPVGVIKTGPKIKAATGIPDEGNGVK